MFYYKHKANESMQIYSEYHNSNESFPHSGANRDILADNSQPLPSFSSPLNLSHTHARRGKEKVT